MKGLLLSCLFVCVGSFYLLAQQAMPVKWTFSLEKINQQSYELIITADVEDGWYVYSQEMEEGGPVPTQFRFENTDAIEFVGKAVEIGEKKEGYDDLFGMNVVKYSNKVKFLQKLNVKKGVKTLEGIVEYMTCDETRCLPPTELPFTVALK